MSARPTPARLLLATTAAVLALTMFLPGLSAAGTSQSTVVRVTPSTTEQRFVVLVNRVRQRHGIKPLRYSDTVSKQALAWARMLASPRWVGRLAHSPSYWTGIRSACQVAAAGAENVAARREFWLGRRKALARRTARGLLGQYLRSAPHRANLLDPRATHIGVATRIRRTSGGHYYAANVVRFARASSC